MVWNNNSGITIGGGANSGTTLYKELNDFMTINIKFTHWANPSNNTAVSESNIMKTTFYYKDVE